MWINIGDHADTNDSDKQTVDRPVVVCGWEILLDRLVCARIGIPCTSSRAPIRDLTTNGERDPGVRRDDAMRSPG